MKQPLSCLQNHTRVLSCEMSTVTVENLSKTGMPWLQERAKKVEMALGTCGESGRAGAISVHLLLADNRLSAREAGIVIIHAVHGWRGQGMQVWAVSSRACTLCLVN